jgi:hypothetical protein
MIHRVLIVIVFLLFIFFRFYQLEERLAFGWDQTMNAWVVKDLLVDQKFPLVGMAAKGNSGVYIGPAYYYVLAGFYAVTKLHPIAAGYCAGVMSVVTGIVLFLVIRKIYSERVAIIALCIAAISNKVIFSDRLAGPVNLLPLVSILIFYFLYKVIKGSSKFLPLLAMVIGFSFHLHVTAMYYIFISLLCFPFILRQKIPLRLYVLSGILFFIWFIPNIVANIQQHNMLAITTGNFFNTFYHGFHLRRVLQLLPDAFIEYESIILLGPFSFIRYMMVPVFIVLIWLREDRKKALIIIYLTLIWYVVPWFVLSCFRGEISDYYFISTRFPTLCIIGYCIDSIVATRKWYLIGCVGIFLLWFTYNNCLLFWRSNDRNFIKQQERAKDYIRTGTQMEFQEGIAESYIYSYYRNFDGK